MKEKVLITSEKYNVLKLLKTLMIIGAILSFIGLTILISQGYDFYNDCQETYLEHQSRGYCYRFDTSCYNCDYINSNQPKLFVAIYSQMGEGYYIAALSPFLGLSLIGMLLYIWLNSYELTVTDKRIYGKVAWGKRVDLPVDAISATATISVWRGIAVSTSSGKISFLAIKNSDEIYKIMNNLIVERQHEKGKVTVMSTMPNTDEADQLKKYKDLLDSGVITQEEFEAKKRQLLGL